MLVLTRKPGQSVIVGNLIGGNIKVQVLGIRKDGGVRLGFEAPRQVAIAREEVWEDQTQKKAND
jgi:carbon storage regulator CsrA